MTTKNDLLKDNFKCEQIKKLVPELIDSLAYLEHILCKSTDVHLQHSRQIFSAISTNTEHFSKKSIEGFKSTLYDGLVALSTGIKGFKINSFPEEAKPKAVVTLSDIAYYQKQIVAIVSQ